MSLTAPKTDEAFEKWWNEQTDDKGPLANVVKDIALDSWQAARAGMVSREAVEACAADMETMAKTAEAHRNNEGADSKREYWFHQGVHIGYGNCARLVRELGKGA